MEETTEREVASVRRTDDAELRAARRQVAAAVMGELARDLAAQAVLEAWMREREKRDGE